MVDGVVITPSDIASRSCAVASNHSGEVGAAITTFETLGNTGSVALPATLAAAVEAGAVRDGERVGLLGIGSGLNCLMLALEW